MPGLDGSAEDIASDLKPGELEPWIQDGCPEGPDGDDNI